MTDENGAPAPGWYPTDDGRERWWDGAAWGPSRSPAEAAPAPVTSPAPAPVAAAAAAPVAAATGAPQTPAANASPGVSGLDVTALILSVFAAPVGLVLGIIGLAKAKRSGRRATLALVATIIGAVGTVAAIVLTVSVVAIAQGVDGAQRRSEFCARAADVPAIVEQWAVLEPLVAELYEPRIGSPEPDPATLQQLSADLSTLSSRIGDVVGNVGGSYSEAFNAGWAFADDLDTTVSDIEGSSFAAYGDELYAGDLQEFVDATAATCG